MFIDTIVYGGASVVFMMTEHVAKTDPFKWRHISGTPGARDNVSNRNPTWPSNRRHIRIRM